MLATFLISPMRRLELEHWFYTCPIFTINLLLSDFSLCTCWVCVALSIVALHLPGGWGLKQVGAHLKQVGATDSMTVPESMCGTKTCQHPEDWLLLSLLLLCSTLFHSTFCVWVWAITLLLLFLFHHLILLVD